jgi:hypothetical protein
MAEIYGSFGRVITGNTLGSSVASLARQILSDKISRIFNAYRDEVQYEGSLLDASAAISKLTEMLGLVQTGSEAEKDIKEYIDAIRQEDRKRRANKAINKVDLAGAENKDYPELIKAIKGILADPTITETEKEAYKAALANQTRNYINNVMRQFNDGGSVTVDGKTVDFGMSANHSQLTSIIGGLMTDNPDMRMEIGKAFDQSRAMVMLKAAEFAFAENKDISNNGRAAAYEKLKKSTQEAYDLLAKSEFDLANSGVALDLLKDITKYSENIQDYKDAAASEYARDYVNKGNAKATSYFDAVDKFATQVLGNAKDAITGGTSLANLVLSGDIDAVYRYLDAVAANNKGNTGFTIDGKSYSISRDAFFDGIRTTRKIFNALDDFSSGNKNVHPDDQTYFSEAAGRYNVFIQGKEIFTIEDKYDAARDTMIKNIRSSGGDIYKIREAYIKFGQVLSGLASTYGPNSLVYDELMTESRLYVSGDVGKGDQLTYGVVSGNFDLGTEKYEDYLAEPLSAHDIAANTRRDLLETFVDFDGDKITIPRNLGPDSVLSYEGVKFARPSWAADGIKVKGLTGPNEVHQIIPIQDSLGKEKGWISFVNGKFIGGTRSNGKYTFYNSSDITRNLASLGITSPSDMELLFTDSGMVSNVNIAILGSKRELTLDQMEVRNGTWEDRVTGVQGENAGITPNKDEFDTYIKDLIDKKQIKLLPPAPSYAQQKTEDRILIKDDQGNWVAATALLDDSVVEQIMDRLPMITTPPGTDGDFGGTTRIPGLGGFGMGKGGTGTKPALTPEQQEAEYMRRGQMPSGGTRSTTLPTPPRVDPNRDLGYGEQVPITPPGGPSTGTSPVTGTTPVTGPSPITRTGPIKTTTAIKPIASLTSQAMVDFRAGERQSLTSTKSTAVGGFFRNSPFKIAL